MNRFLVVNGMRDNGYDITTPVYVYFYFLPPTNISYLNKHGDVTSILPDSFSCLAHFINDESTKNTSTRSDDHD